MRNLIYSVVLWGAAGVCFLSWGCAAQPVPPQTVDQWMDLEPVKP
jgi:hypothetical protein